MTPRARAAWRCCVAAGVAAALAACTTAGLDATLPLPTADVALFAAAAQPTLALRCANPSCHGRPGPLQLYAVALHRRAAADTFALRPLDEGELRHNLRECLPRLDLQEPAASPLLTMALHGPSAGGAGGHRFGPVFADGADDDYRQLAAWVRAVAGDPSAAAIASPASDATAGAVDAP